MMSIKETQDEIIEGFQVYDDWMDRYNYLIELAKDLEPLDKKYKNNEYLIKGCQSKVWLYADLQDNKVVFKADSDAIIVKGIITLLIKVLSNRSPQEIMNTELYFIEETGLKQNLSPTRSNGLLAMVKQMKLYALAYDAKSKM